jgi:hypothetical protein
MPSGVVPRYPRWRSARELRHSFGLGRSLLSLIYYHAPKAVTDQLQQLNDWRFSNMADVMRATPVQGGEPHQAPGHRLPIEAYDELTVDEVLSRLRGGTLNNYRGPDPTRGSIKNVRPC